MGLRGHRSLDQAPRAGQGPLWHANLEREINEYYWNAKVDLSLLEVRNLVCVAELIVRSALKRKESRGLHYTLDFPDLAEEAVNTMVPPLRR